jgi:membrane-bound lytic murein transglycosylase F
MRGWEPVTFVDNVRNYYKIIAWHEKQAEIRLASSGSTLSTLGKSTTSTTIIGNTDKVSL